MRARIFFVNAVKKVLADSEHPRQLGKIMLTARFIAGKEYNDPWTDYEKTVKAVLDAISK